MSDSYRFTDLGLDSRLLKRLDVLGFTEPTEVQAKAIPFGLLNKDLAVSSKTGSGKTLAYLLPALQRIIKQKSLSPKDPRVLILLPTRELAKQVFQALKKVSDGLGTKLALIVGGENFNDQVKVLRKRPDVVVGTVGRIADHLEDKSLFLQGLELLILDEADRMMDLGFATPLRHIHKAADHRKRQTMMFSATLQDIAVIRLADELFSDVKKIAVDEAGTEHGDIRQQYLLADDLSHKEKLLVSLLQQHQGQQSIVFTATRDDTERLAALLAQQDISALALSGELNQSQRKQIMETFALGKHKVLVTTDLGSRGLDIASVTQVINFDMPRIAEEYVHRIGRTGRAGEQGEAFSLVGPKDWYNFQSVCKFLSYDIEKTSIAGCEASFTGLAEKKAPKSNKTIKSNKVEQQPKLKRKTKTSKPDLSNAEDIGHRPVMRRKPTDEA